MFLLSRADLLASIFVDVSKSFKEHCLCVLNKLFTGMELDSIYFKFAWMKIRQGIQLTKEANHVIVTFACYFKYAKFLW